MVSQMNSKNANPKTYLYFGITFLSLFGVTFCCVVCFCSRIKLAVGILKAAGEFVKDNVSVLFIPPLTFLIFAIYFIYWLTVAIYLYSSGTLNTQPHQLPFAQF